MQPFLSDALVTLREYQAAADAAIACAGGGEFAAPDPGGVGRLSLKGDSGCARDYFEPIDAIWKLQVRAEGVDALKRARAKVMEDSQTLEMLSSETGERVLLASGSDWILSTARRGPGWCVYEEEPASSGAGCSVPERWVAPGVGDLSSTDAKDGPDLVSGITFDAVSEVALYFSEGTRTTVETEEPTDLPIRGFGYRFEQDEMGSLVNADFLDERGNILASIDWVSAVGS